jgi:PIN domain nuclease of toxin-antitoxin system
VIVLDTHAWVWWVSQTRRLSKTAVDAIEKSMAERTLRVSCISAWEVSLLVQRQRLKLSMDVHDWIAASEALPVLQFVPVDNRIALRSTALPGKLHQDPADRIIVATTLILGATLVTKDQRLLRYPHVETLW